MTGTAEVPVEWFGQLVPRVGDELELIVVCRVSKIEQDQVSIRTGSDMDINTAPGQTRVTLILNELKVSMDEAERLVRVQ